MMAPDFDPVLLLPDAQEPVFEDLVPEKDARCSRSRSRERTKAQRERLQTLETDVGTLATQWTPELRTLDTVITNVGRLQRNLDLLRRKCQRRLQISLHSVEGGILGTSNVFFTSQVLGSLVTDRVLDSIHKKTLRTGCRFRRVGTQEENCKQKKHQCEHGQNIRKMAQEDARRKKWTG